MTNRTLTVPDISCDHCERAITGALRPVGGIHSVEVDIPGRLVSVSYDEAKVSLEQISTILREEEYPVAGVV